jgi:hypothetical protein
MEEGVDVRGLMEDVAAVVADPSTVVETMSAAGRPRVFGLDYVYPHGTTRGIHFDILARKEGIGKYFDAGSERKYAGWLVTLLKRAVLVAANWYVKPLTDEISEYNRMIAGALLDIDRNIEEMRARLEALEKGADGVEERW